MTQKPHETMFMLIRAVFDNEDQPFLKIYFLHIVPDASGRHWYASLVCHFPQRRNTNTTGVHVGVRIVNASEHLGIRNHIHIN
jgi:hypothetical protein